MANEQPSITVKVLEHIHKHPGMYFSGMAPAVVNFLEGFKLAIAPEDFEPVYADVIRQRGWEISSKAVWQQMQEKGFDEDAVNAEMLAIYLDVWREIERQQKQNTEHKLETTDK